MRTLLAAGFLLVAAFVALTPNVSAYPCQIGDTDNVCVNEYSGSSGDCTNGGYESGQTTASATANGENVWAGGSNQCYNDPYWGYSYTYTNAAACYGGSQGYACASAQGYSDSYGSNYCQVQVQDNLAGYNGYGYHNLPPEVCGALGGVDWGNLV